MQTTIYKLLGEKISRRRMALGLSQRSCAKEIGISLSYLSRIERGFRSAGVSLEIICIIAKCLGLSVSDLLDFGPEDIEHLNHDSDTPYLIDYTDSILIFGEDITQEDSIWKDQVPLDKKTFPRRK